MVSTDHEIVQYFVRRAKEGDKEAFSRLVRLMMKDVVALTYRMTQDRDGAFDLAQETFVSAWQSLRSFREEAKFESWLYRIASNKALNYLKHRSKRPTMSIDSLETEASVSGPISRNPEQLLQVKEMQKDVLEFMAELPDQQRLVFDLRFYKELTFEEIAKFTGKAVGTVKTHYREAIIKLRAFAERKGWRQ
jgi:RNA polymerase sigma factor (sigma-70 family)